MLLTSVSDAAIGSSVLSVLCRQALSGITTLEVNVSEDETGDGSPLNAWSARIGQNARIAAQGDSGGVEFTIVDVVGPPPVGGSCLVRGVPSGVAAALSDAITPQGQVPLLYQRKPGETLDAFTERVFNGHTQLNNPAAPDAGFGPGAVLAWLPGIPPRRVLDDFLRHLSRSDADCGGWTAGNFGDCAVTGCWRSPLPAGYQFLDPWRCDTVRQPVLRPIPLCHRPSWTGCLYLPVPVETAENSIALLAGYIPAWTDQFDVSGGPQAHLARLPGPRLSEMDWGEHLLPVVETVLAVEKENGTGAGWSARHLLLVGAMDNAHSAPAATVSPLRGKFRGWTSHLADGGTLAEFVWAGADHGAEWGMCQPLNEAMVPDPATPLLALIRTPGGGRPDGEHGLHLSPRKGDIFDIELSTGTWPRAVGGVMRSVPQWKAGSAVLNASSIILATRPRQTPDEAEVSISPGRVTLARQAAISTDGSTFNKCVRIRPKLEVDA